ncbi:MAG: DbpA RNA binding domain-containing protein [Gemmatimonadota bacterium]|nr:MAG: DbpA RNA binding domain-containing protein [Gemmatimonadota bacterium]
MSWEFASGIDAGHRASLNAGKNLIYVSPPAWWTARGLMLDLPEVSDAGLHTVIIVPDAFGLEEGAGVAQSVESLRPVHAVTGLARTGRLLSLNAVGTLVTTPADLIQLLSRSSISLDRVRRLVIGWPESLLELEKGDELDTILAESGNAQRVIITVDDAKIGDFLERHARRAPRAIASSIPATGTVSVRYAVTDDARLQASVRSALDIINPTSALIWDPTPAGPTRWAEYRDEPSIEVVATAPEEPVDLAIAVTLPTSEALDALDLVAGELLVTIQAHQVSYLKAMTSKATSFRLPNEVDRARDRAGQLREEVRGLIAEGRGSAELLALEPLFDEYDPATVASALAARTVATSHPPGPAPGLPSWVHLRVSAGSRDRIRTSDLVGALLNAVGITKTQIGRIEVREGHSMLEVRSEVAETVRRGVDGLVLRGKKVAARIDRR